MYTSNGLKGGISLGRHLPNIAKALRRTSWRSLAPRDDSVAGPGPSSLAAASTTATALPTSRCRRAARAAAAAASVCLGGWRPCATRTPRLSLRAASLESSSLPPDSLGGDVERSDQPGRPSIRRDGRVRGMRGRAAGSPAAAASLNAEGQEIVRNEASMTSHTDLRDAATANGRPVKSILDIAAAAPGKGGGALGGAATGTTAAVTAGAIGDGGGSNGDGDAAFSPIRLLDGRQLVKVVPDTPSAAAASALSHALGMEQRAVVRFDGGAGALKGLRTLTLANIFLGGFQRALSFVVDVKQVSYGRPSPLEERPQSGDVSYMYRVMARARSLEAYDKQLPAAIRQARFLLDLSINVRQAWDMKGDVDEEQAYDLADTLYGALLARQEEEDAEEELAHQSPSSSSSEQQQQQQQQQQEQQLQEQQQQQHGPGRQTSHNQGARSEFPHDPLTSRSGARWPGEEFEGPGGRWRRRQQLEERRALARPWVIVSADLGQGPTMLTALGLLQKRLREERQKAVVETTLYRASVAAPRLNGKDGWVYIIGLGFEGPYMPMYGRERRYTRSSAPPAGAARRGGSGADVETEAEGRRRGLRQQRAPGQAGARAAGRTVDSAAATSAAADVGSAVSSLVAAAR